MSIAQWPEEERPREKLLTQGAAQLSDAELLAIFLRTGCRGASAVDLAHKLLEAYGGLRGLLLADYASFVELPGMGPAKFVQFQAIHEVSRRFLWETLQAGDVLSSPQATSDYLLAQMRGHEQEVFACLYLDSQHRLIDYVEHFFGTIDAAVVYPRVLVRHGLACNAAAVILAHNHPSGVAEPSQADQRITEQIKAALALVDIRLLDHIIVGAGAVVSLCERGYI